MHIINGMSAAELPTVSWLKSRRSGGNGNCVEVAKLPDDAGYAVRNSRDPQGATLVYTRDELAAFIDGARDGDFDQLLD